MTSRLASWPARKPSPPRGPACCLLSRGGKTILIAVEFIDKAEAKGFYAALLDRGKTHGRIDLVLHTGEMNKVS